MKHLSQTQGLALPDTNEGAEQQKHTSWSWWKYKGDSHFNNILLNSYKTKGFSVVNKSLLWWVILGMGESAWKAMGIHKTSRRTPLYFLLCFAINPKWPKQRVLKMER